MDYGHKMTDKELQKLEKKISSAYRAAQRELDKTIKEYFEQFRLRDEAEKKRVEAGEVTQQEYTQWRLAQIGRGKRFSALRDKCAERITKAHEIAVAYVNDATPGIYSLNRNYSAYQIEQTGANVDFTLWNEATVRRLLIENPELMPYYPPKRAVKRGIDLAYGRRQITASVTSSILQGKSISGIADDLQSRIYTMDRESAIRTARTAVTGAQNAGRQDACEAAHKMGIEIKKQWVATLDGRTRRSHAHLDGETVDYDDVFSNGCRFPGDPRGKPAEVYNCRCRMIQLVNGVEFRAKRRIRDENGQNVVVDNITYKEWERMKKNGSGQSANRNR